MLLIILYCCRQLLLSIPEISNVERTTVRPDVAQLETLFKTQSRYVRILLQFALRGPARAWGRRRVPISGLDRVLNRWWWQWGACAIFGNAEFQGIQEMQRRPSSSQRIRVCNTNVYNVFLVDIWHFILRHGRPLLKSRREVQ